MHRYSTIEITNNNIRNMWELAGYAGLQTLCYCPTLQDLMCPKTYTVRVTRVPCKDSSPRIIHVRVLLFYVSNDLTHGNCPRCFNTRSVPEYSQQQQQQPYILYCLSALCVFLSEMLIAFLVAPDVSLYQ